MIGERRGLTLYLLALEPSLLMILMAGLLGGMAVAVYALKNGRYRNNKYFEKILVESIGGLVSSGLFMTIFFGPFVTSSLLVSFAFGLGWGIIAQAIRASITRYVVEFIEQGILFKIIQSRLGVLHSLGFTNLSDEQVSEYQNRLSKTP